MKDIIWGSVHYCTRCKNAKGEFPPRACAGGITVTIFGKEMKGVCKWNPPKPTFKNPNKTILVIIKMLLELEKKARDE